MKKNKQTPTHSPHPPFPTKIHSRNSNQTFNKQANKI